MITDRFVGFPVHAKKTFSKIILSDYDKCTSSVGVSESILIDDESSSGSVLLMKRCNVLLAERSMIIQSYRSGRDAIWQQVDGFHSLRSVVELDSIPKAIQKKNTSCWLLSFLGSIEVLPRVQTHFDTWRIKMVGCRHHFPQCFPLSICLSLLSTFREQSYDRWWARRQRENNQQVHFLFA